MPPAVIAIVSGIEMAIRLLPGVVDLVTKAKAFIGSLFGAGVITEAQQNALFARIDEIVHQAAAGTLPIWWSVEPDPGNTTTTTATTTTSETKT
jgi:hypothetical protein